MSSYPFFDLLCSHLDPKQTTVKALPDRVWVFGGPTEDIKRDPGSLRDQFIRAVYQKGIPLSKNIETPEDYQAEWLTFAEYDDLLAFEQDAGQLAQAIVLFSETPGSWAELGAFASEDALCDKLFVVISKRHRESSHKSFIGLGPLKRAANRQPEDQVICVIDAEKAADFDDADINAVIKALAIRLRRVHKTETFKAENRMHQLLLIADLANLCHALYLEELVEILRIFGVITDKRALHRAAKLLHMLGLVRFTIRGTDLVILNGGKSVKPLIDYQAAKNPALVRYERTNFKLNTWSIVQKDQQLMKALAT